MAWELTAQLQFSKSTRAAKQQKCFFKKVRKLLHHSKYFNVFRSFYPYCLWVSFLLLYILPIFSLSLMIYQFKLWSFSTWLFLLTIGNGYWLFLARELQGRCVAWHIQILCFRKEVPFGVKPTERSKHHNHVFLFFDTKLFYLRFAVSRPPIPFICKGNISLWWILLQRQMNRGDKKEWRLLFPEF